MRTLYLIGAIVFFLLILVLALPQFGATCVWYLINPNSSPPFVIVQASLLGAVMGGLLVLFWKAPKKKDGEDDDEDGEGEK